jgi:hypothetical protein
MLKISLLPALPCKLKVTVEEEALTPKTVPLLISLPVVREEEPFQIASKPVVPVPETKPLAAKVICPGVVVVIEMPLPATRLVGAYLVPVPSAANNWPVTVGAVEVAVPPLATPNIPLTSLEPRAIAPLNRLPPVVLLTGRALERLAMVVEPFTATEKKDCPVVEATVKIGRVWAEEEA